MFRLIYLRGLFLFSQIWKKKNREIMPVKTVTSPSSAPQVTFRQATRGVSNENVKQDTWHVWKPIFWYMHLYHALLSKRTCGYYLCFFFWFPLFLKFFIIHPPPVTRGGGGEERKETSPSSHFHVLDLVSFLVRPKPRIAFFGLFLLRNQTETLAAQASF